MGREEGGGRVGGGSTAGRREVGARKEGGGDVEGRGGRAGRTGSWRTTARSPRRPSSGGGSPGWLVVLLEPRALFVWDKIVLVLLLPPKHIFKPASRLLNLTMPPAWDLKNLNLDEKKTFFFDNFC